MGTVIEGPIIGLVAELFGWQSMIYLMIAVSLLGAMATYRGHMIQSRRWHVILMPSLWLNTTGFIMSIDTEILHVFMIIPFVRFNSQFSSCWTCKTQLSHFHIRYIYIHLILIAERQKDVKSYLFVINPEVMPFWLSRDLIQDFLLCP